MKSNSAPIPGAANSFDSSSYLVLVTTDNIIQTTKSDLAANAFPATVAPKVKETLNYLIQAYNVANVAYQQYHAAALSGQATVVQQNQVTNALNNVQTATANLTSAKTVTP